MSAVALAYEELVVQVSEAWADVLGNDSAEEVPLDVNFFELGGNSLLLVMLWEQLQPIAAGPVKLSDLFHHGTVAAQAELLTGNAERSAPAEPTGTADMTWQGDPRSLLARRRAALSGGLP